MSYLDNLDYFYKRVELVENAENEALQVFGEINKAAKALQDLKEKVLPYALLDFESYGEKTVETFGFKFSKTSSGRYDYSKIPEWKSTKEKLKAIEKRAQEAYKVAKNGTLAISEETGEVIEAAEYKSNKTSLKIG